MKLIISTVLIALLFILFIWQSIRVDHLQRHLELTEIQLNQEATRNAHTSLVIRLCDAITELSRIVDIWPVSDSVFLDMYYQIPTDTHYVATESWKMWSRSLPDTSRLLMIPYQKYRIRLYSR